jgi:hypothetical protein
MNIDLVDLLVVEKIETPEPAGPKSAYISKKNK